MVKCRQAMAVQQSVSFATCPDLWFLPLFAICWTAPWGKLSSRLRCALYALGVALATISAFPLLT